jgi:hypothetical protein
MHYFMSTFQPVAPDRSVHNSSSSPIQMAVHCVHLPGANDSESSSDDLIPPPIRHVPPRRSDPIPNHDLSPFEVPEEGTTVHSGPIDYVSLGLAPLSFDNDPFLSPVPQIQGIVKRRKVWIGGVKGLKFTFSIQGTIVLAAKRRREVKEESYLISTSSDFALDSPNFAGIVIRQRTTSDFTVLSARERQSDGARQGLAAIRIAPRAVVIGKTVWLPPKLDSMFLAELTDENSYALEVLQHGFSAMSVKNAALGRAGDSQPLFLSEKQSDGTLAITIREPLCLLQGFGLAIALFAQ